MESPIKYSGVHYRSLNISTLTSSDIRICLLPEVDLCRIHCNVYFWVLLTLHSTVKYAQEIDGWAVNCFIKRITVLIEVLDWHPGQHLPSIT